MKTIESHVITKIQLVEILQDGVTIKVTQTKNGEIIHDQEYVLNLAQSISFDNLTTLSLD